MKTGPGNARPPHPHATSLGYCAPPRPPGTTRGERSHPQNTLTIPLEASPCTCVQLTERASQGTSRHPTRSHVCRRRWE
eukprot:4404990-Pyramimonas_sp.AAC.1